MYRWENPYNELEMLGGDEAQGAQTHARGCIFYQWDTRGRGGGNHLSEVIINMQGLHLNKVLVLTFQFSNMYISLFEFTF